MFCPGRIMAIDRRMSRMFFRGTTKEDYGTFYPFKRGTGSEN
jgi:hypothetical protein